MKNNQLYQSPTLDIVEIIVESAILAASAEHSDPEFGE